MALFYIKNKEDHLKQIHHCERLVIKMINKTVYRKNPKSVPEENMLFIETPDDQQ